MMRTMAAALAGSGPRLAAALVMVLVARAAAGDWLVTRDGARVETKGPWLVKGRLITFTALPSGSLSSLRASEVDLQASAEATRAALAPPAPTPAAPAEERRKPVLVLTDADVAHVSEEQLALTPADPTAADPAGGTAKPSPSLVVAGWDRTYSESEQGVIVSGTVRNVGKAMEGGIQLTVRVFDDQGAMVGVGAGTLSSSTLMPGKSAEFRAVFPGIFVVAAATFDVASSGLQMREEPIDADAPPII